MTTALSVFAVKAVVGDIQASGLGRGSGDNVREETDMLMKSVIGAVVALGLGALPALAEYPEKEIQGIIQWGAGGSTDTVARAITPHAEKILGGTIVMQNVTGGVGAIALNQVAKLVAAYTEAAKNPVFIALIDGRGFKMLSLSGAEADAFLTEWQSRTAWLIHGAGLTKASPEDFGIAMR
jgi:tripartite-type tricarboxylate transporter receptor subunit TctC